MEDIKQEATDMEDTPVVAEEEIESPAEQAAEDAAVAEVAESVEEHADSDEAKWADVFTRLDALEARIGELVMSGAVLNDEAVVDENEPSAQEEEVQALDEAWYERNRRYIEEGSY